MKIRNIKKVKGLLIKLNACPEAIRWVGDRDLHTALRDCKRADWLIWLAARMVGKRGFPTHKQVAQMACICARTALQYVSKGEDRPRIAIETVEKWIRNEATIREVQAAADAAADAADAADAAAATGAAAAAGVATGAAAYAAADAAADAADAADAAAGVATYAADAAAYAAAYAFAAYAAAYAAAHRQMCDLLREYLDKE